MKTDTMSLVQAESMNAAMQRIGVGIRMEYITPGDAKRYLQQNPELLREYGLSQKMSGDTSDETIDAAKGRPYVDTLVEHIKEGRWRYYFGAIHRAPNGAILDGVTRMICISKAGIPVWVQCYNNADPKDFYMYDDPKSGRTEKDILGSLGVPSEIAGILGIMAPKAAGLADEEGGYHRVTRNCWFKYYKKYESSFLEAANFVKRERGQDRVPRKNLTAYVYFKFVSRPGTKDPDKARHLLSVYKSKRSTNAVEDQLRDLNSFVCTHKNVLHERTQFMPLFIRVMKAAMNGEVLKYRIVAQPTRPGKSPDYTVRYLGGKKPKKGA